MKALVSVGRTPIARLAWLLDFAQFESSDLAPLSKLEIEQLQAEMNAFPFKEGYQIPGGTGPRPTALSSEQIGELRSTPRNGLRGFASRKGWTLSIERLRRRVARNRGGNTVGVKTASSRECILMAAADLIEREGYRITRCALAECARLFVKRKRGAYCSVRCSQKTRTERFQMKHSKELYERRHRYYLEQVRREKGEKVAKHVRRRGPLGKQEPARRVGTSQKRG